MQELLGRLREGPQCSREGARSTEVAQLRRESATRAETRRCLELQKAIERTSVKCRGAHAGSECSGSLDDALRCQCGVAVARAQPGDASKAEVLIDERADELVDHTTRRGRSSSPQQELAERRVVPGPGRPERQEPDRRADRCQTEQRIEARIEIAKPTRIVATRRSSDGSVIARCRKSRGRDRLARACRPDSREALRKSAAPSEEAEAPVGRATSPQMTTATNFSTERVIGTRRRGQQAEFPP